MAMRVTDKLVAVSRGSVAEVVRYFINVLDLKRWDDFLDYIEAVYDIAPQVGIDPAIVIAQASHETDKFRSYWWNTRLNPAGLGITGDPDQNDASRIFQNGRESARAQIAHLLLYATGTISSPLTNDDDPRYDAYIYAYGPRATATTIGELGTRWAVSPLYGTAICNNHGNYIFPELPESESFPPPVEPVEPVPVEPPPIKPPKPKKKPKHGRFL